MSNSLPYTVGRMLKRIWQLLPMLQKLSFSLPHTVCYYTLTWESPLEKMLRGRKEKTLPTNPLGKCNLHWKGAIEICRDPLGNVVHMVEVTKNHYHDIQIQLPRHSVDSGGGRQEHLQLWDPIRKICWIFG